MQSPSLMSLFTQKQMAQTPIINCLIPEGDHWKYRIDWTQHGRRHCEDRGDGHGVTNQQPITGAGQELRQLAPVIRKVSVLRFVTCAMLAKW